MLFYKIKKLIKKIYLYILKHLSVDKYLNFVGVNFPVGFVKLYGRVEWGSEPWMITLGSNVHITDGVKFLTHDGGTLICRHIVPDLDISKPIKLGDNVYIGNNAIILPGVNIGSNVIIGAGAIVSKDIPENTVAVGIPAKVIKTLDEYIKKTQEESTHLGNLKGKAKDVALKKYFGYLDEV